MQPQEDNNQPQQPEQPQPQVSPPPTESQPTPPDVSQTPAQTPVMTPGQYQSPQPDVVAPMTPGSSPVQPQSQPPIMSSPLPGGAPKSNKKLFIVLGAVFGGLLLLGIIGWIVYSVFFAVTKTDYAAASAVTNDIRTKASVAYGDISTLTFISSSGTQVKATNDIDAARDSIKELKAENGKFKDLRALRDAEVKEAYDKYIAQFAKFNTYSNDILDSMEKLFPALKKCGDTSSLSTSNIASYQVALAGCISSLEDAKDLPDPDLNTLSAATLTAMTAVKTAMDELATLPSSNYQRANEIRQNIYSAQAAYRDATTSARSNLEKRGKEAEIKDAYNDLADLLNEKQFK